MPKNAISVLNALVDVCRNGEEGYLEAARLVRDTHLRAVFSDFSQQREQFATQLQYQIARLGGVPEGRGTLSGALHRRWIDLRSATGRELAVISECERGERHALRAYEDAISQRLPPEVREVIQQQHLQVKAALDVLVGLQTKLKDQHAF